MKPVKKDAIPRIVDSGQLPLETAKACYELIAYTLNLNTVQSMIHLAGVTVEGVRVGDLEITVRNLG